MKRVLITSSGSKDACELYRIKEVYENIKSTKIEFVFSEDNTLNDNVFNFHAVLLQRPAAKGLPDAINKIKEKKILVVTETDDDLLSLPISNPAYQYYKGERIEVYKECLKLSDYIHTSTPELHPKGVVFHNAIDTKKYTLKKHVNGKTVFWAGSSTHFDSLALIKSVIEELLRLDIKVIMMGQKDWLKPIFNNEKLIIHDWISLDYYYLATSMADIFLTPLPDNKFSRAKSELKCIEAAAWGIPSVSSPTAPYLRFNKISGGGNTIVKEKHISWLDAILELIEDDNLWRKKSELSYNAVQSFYNLELINKKRVAWWESILC